MTSRERIKTAARGGIPDMVPVAPYIGNYGAALAGVPISEYNTNGRNMAEAQVRSWEKHQLDVVVAQSDNYYIAEAFGVQIKQPYNDTPHVVKTAIDSLAEVDKLPDFDPYKDGRMYVYFEAVSRMRELLGNDVAIRSGGTGMFSMAGHALGTQKFLTELALAEIDEDEEAQEQLVQLLDYTTQSLIKFSTGILEAGCDFVVCGDSSASPDLVSPAVYQKYIFPFEQKYFTAMKPLCEKYDAVSLLHICGNTTPNLNLMAQTGADILELDYKVDLLEARKIVGDRVCLMGNLDPTSVLLEGTPELVEEKAQQAIADAGRNGAFILGSGCEVATRTPLENLLAMSRVARAHKY